MTSYKQIERQVVLYFQVHQPRRLKRISFFEIGKELDYFDDELNRRIMERVAIECYTPVNKMLIELAHRTKNLRVVFSISGVALEQMEKFAPPALESFKELNKTGCIEFLAETSHHSLASLQPSDEFLKQIKLHGELMQTHFGVNPAIFCNTELIYSNSIGSRVAQLGYKGMITDNVKSVVSGRNSEQVYLHPVNPNFRILLRNNEFSDDIAFRYDEEETLNVDHYVARMKSAIPAGGVMTLGLDYETFGEHKKANSGIIDFLKDLIIKVDEDSDMTLATASEAFERAQPTEKFDAQDFVSWADRSKDITAWLGNNMQKDAFKNLHELGEKVTRANDAGTIQVWRDLQTSDHLYYMSTKGWEDGKVHAYFSPYSSPYEAFVNYMDVLNDFALRVKNLPANAYDLKDIEYERQHQEMPEWAREHYADHSSGPQS